MQIVSENKIPLINEIINVPTNNLAKILKICLEMQVVCEQQKGIGLSAVQVGIPWKLFIIKTSISEYNYFVDCEYTPTEEAKTITSLEGCLSIRSKEGDLRYFEVNRYDKIRVTGQNLTFNNKIELKNIDFILDVSQKSIVFQHEIDHHLGKLISDIGKEVFIW